MTQSQELQIASVVEQKIGTSDLRNSVEYVVRRTESLGDRIRALEDNMNDLGDNGRLPSARQNPERMRREVQDVRRETADARWALKSATSLHPFSSEAEQGGNASKTQSTPQNIGPPSTPRDRPLSVGAHRRLRSASPAASDGAERCPEVSEAWGVDPPRIPRRVTPPPA